MKHPTTIILLAGEAEARVLKTEGPGEGLIQIAHLEPSFDPEDEEFADQQGRTFDSHGDGRHKKEPRSTPRETKRERFARELSDYLSEAHKRGGYDRLVIAAAPQMLGILRGLLDGAVGESLAGDLNKELVKVPLADLPRHLEGLVKL